MSSRSNPLAPGRHRPVTIWTVQTAATEVPAQTIRPSNTGDRIQKAGGNGAWFWIKSRSHSVTQATAAQTAIPVATATQAEIPGWRLSPRHCDRYLRKGKTGNTRFQPPKRISKIESAPPTRLIHCKVFMPVGSRNYPKKYRWPLNNPLSSSM
jgi:hypothetical protein